MIRVCRAFIFLRFLHVSNVDSNALVAAVQPPPEGDSKLLHGDASHYPFPGILDGLRGHPNASQLLLHPPKQEEVRWGEIWGIGRVLQQLDVVGGQPRFDDGSGVDGRIIPVEKPLLGYHLWPLLPQVLHEGAQGLHDVIGIDHGTPGHNVGIDQALVVKKRQQHLFCSAGVNPCLYGPRLTLLYPLFRLLFCLRCVIGHHGLVHGYDAVQHRHGAALNGGNELLAGSDTLLFLVLAEQLGDQPCRLNIGRCFHLPQMPTMRDLATRAASVHLYEIPSMANLQQITNCNSINPKPIRNLYHNIFTDIFTRYTYIGMVSCTRQR
jgi:hypothetical protein